MVIKMTNRLLATVIAFALSSGIVAAAQSPQQPFAGSPTAAATSLPGALQTTAARIAEKATGTIDPARAIRNAFQRDHVALERLRQQGSQLEGSAHPAFNQYISDQEDALASIQRTALATTRPTADSTIDAMDQLVAAAQAEFARQLAQPNATKDQSSGPTARSHPSN